MDFKEQVVVITGAGQGIGQATAYAFAQRGSRVVVNDLQRETAEATTRTINERGGQAIAVQADVADEAAVRTIFYQAQHHFGAVTTLINNAGYVPFLPLMDYTAAIWDKTMAVDLKGIFYCVQAAVPQMERRGGGRIVNIASVHASATLPGTSAYAAAKGGIVSLTRTLALELGPKHIRVNCISPGAIETDALKAYFDSLPPEESEARRQYLLGWHPLGRFGQPDDIAQVALFLCSDQAAFIHGSEIVADGGCLARLF
jgi:NAD(P)-dependent dehydrogenase (short-subunit alcohol dehydrogenase family)